MWAFGQMFPRRLVEVSDPGQCRSVDAPIVWLVGGHDSSASSPHRPSDPTGPVGEPPSPAGVRTLDELVTRLSQLRAWSGLGYREVHRRVVELRRRRHRGPPEQVSFDTVYRCMRPGRSRLDVELVVDIARVLLGEGAAAAAWRMALQVLGGRAGAAGIVRVFPALPDDLPGFTGRRAELRWLLDGLASQRPDAAAAVAVIEGMAGVGKTTLVIHAGHQLLHRGHGTDLQLSVDLRGYDAELPPADPAAVLEGFLRVLGVPGDQIYQLDLAGRAARYRRLLAGRRALIVLDNAASQEQVTPLLPQTAGGLTMITTRNTLDNLSGARRLRLDTFSEAEALELLRRTVGPDRVDAAPQVASAIAGLVGCLPLALGVVAGRINDSHGWTLADHLARLTERHQLRRLDSGIELALDLSYHALTSDLRQTLRLLALHRGRDFSAYAAAASGADLPTTTQRLNSLLAADLLQRPTPTRYHLHDLIQIYANARAIDDEPDSARQSALTRLFDSYLFTSAQAMDALAPIGQHRRPTIPTPPTPTPPIADRAAARAWLVAEHANLLVTIAHTAGQGWPTHTTRLSATLSRWLSIGGHLADALTVYGHALDAARGSGDRAAEGVAPMNLGTVRERLGQYRDAGAALHQALQISREVGDRYTEGRFRGPRRYRRGTRPLPQRTQALGSGGRLPPDRRPRRRGQRPQQHRRHLRTNGPLPPGDHPLPAGTGDQPGGRGPRPHRHCPGRPHLDPRQAATPARGPGVPPAALAVYREHGYRAGEALILSLYGLMYGADHPDTAEQHQRAATSSTRSASPRSRPKCSTTLAKRCAPSGTTTRRGGSTSWPSNWLGTPATAGSRPAHMTASRMSCTPPTSQTTPTHTGRKHWPSTPSSVHHWPARSRHTSTR